MDPDENSTEELEAVPSDMFDSSSPSPTSLGLGWAGAAAAGALFAVRTEATGLLPHTLLLIASLASGLEEGAVCRGHIRITW